MKMVDKERKQEDLARFWISALDWVMTQPGLIRTLPGGPQSLLDHTDPRLKRLRDHTMADPDAFMRALSGPRAHKIGIIYENLICWGAIHGLGYQLLARDLQVHDGTRTLGALDLLHPSPKGSVEHWEHSDLWRALCSSSCQPTSAAEVGQSAPHSASGAQPRHRRTASGRRREDAAALWRKLLIITDLPWFLKFGRA